MQRNKCLHSLGGARGARNYLKFTALAASTIALVKVGNPLDVSLVTSLNGAPWQSYTTGNTISLNEGDEIRWRAATVNSQMANSANNYHNFVMTGSLSASGVVMSLLDSTLHSKVLQGNATFFSLFKDCTSLVSAPRLGFYRFTGSGACQSMFSGCTGLVDVPALDVQLFGYQSCASMFSGCTSLINAPIIDAQLGFGCCASMFSGCTGLVDASNINLRGEVTGAEFWAMFQGCTSLVNVPTLNLTLDSVNQYTFQSMFSGCTSLVDASNINLRGNVFSGREMFLGCSALTNAPTIDFNGIGSYGLYHAFQGCTSLVDARSISFVGDYQQHALEGAFASCTSLIYPPILSMNNAVSVQTWVAAFMGCTSLEEIKLDFPATTSTQWQSNTFQYCLTNCNAITDITITWEEWPDSAMVSGMFGWPNKSGVTLHVKPTLDISSLSTYGIPASWTVVQDA